ncbi:histone-fold-containing protein [Phakopsora pachyrhizi]|nr:histone-fold-containing protein [Phakopsora pachyrhizi]
MSSGGKAGKAAKAGLQFPVGHYATRFGAGAPAVLEYLAAEILKLAGNAARDNKKSRIIPRHLQLAIRNDEELNRLLGHVLYFLKVGAGGLVPPLLEQADSDVVNVGSGTEEQTDINLSQ